MLTGAAFLRMIDDAASVGDVVEGLKSIDAHPEDLNSYRSMAAMVQDEPLDSRQTWCQSMVLTYYARFYPDPDYEVPVADKFIGTTPVFASLCTPSPYGRWRDHVIARSRTGVGGSDMARISPYLAVRVRALETMWGVEGHLLVV